MTRKNDRTETDLFELKVELLCSGARLRTTIDRGRKAGAGPSGGRYILLPNGSGVNVALRGDFIKESMLELTMEDEYYFLHRSDGDKKILVEIVPNPKFYNEKTSDGTPMWKVALLHGTDCLATTVYQRCTYWNTGKKCKFCGIELSLESQMTIPVKKPHQFREVVEAAVKENVCNHITLTTGTTEPPDRGSKLLIETVKEVKACREIPIHVQVEPPKSNLYLDMLANAGADTIGIHLESFDPAVLKKVCPGKAETKIKRYFETWKHSLELFGENQVSSFIIAGLGENDDNILKGAAKLAEMGVIPYLVPLRPLIDTEFENKSPPKPSRMISLYKRVAEILETYGVNPAKNKAGCVRCGCCSAIKEAGFK
jgi:radical SAM protein (TIGR04043 family)